VGRGIDQQERSVKIVQERFVGEVLKVQQEAMIQLLRLVGVTFGVKENERLAQLVVPSLFGIIGAKLPNDHDAAKHEKTQKKQNEFVLPDKTHAGFLRGSGASAQLN
jgi:hypothetical protein